MLVQGFVYRYVRPGNRPSSGIVYCRRQLRERREGSVNCVVVRNLLLCNVLMSAKLPANGCQHTVLSLPLIVQQQLLHDRAYIYVVTNAQSNTSAIEVETCSLLRQRLAVYYHLLKSQAHQYAILHMYTHCRVEQCRVALTWSSSLHKQLESERFSELLLCSYEQSDLLLSSGLQSLLVVACDLRCRSDASCSCTV